MVTKTGPLEQGHRFMDYVRGLLGVKIKGGLTFVFVQPRDRWGDLCGCPAD